MEIRVNGTSDAVEAGTTLGEYLQGRGLDPLRVAVELNAAIVRRADVGATRLNEGDTVEIVHFVSGG